MLSTQPSAQAAAPAARAVELGNVQVRCSRLQIHIFFAKHCCAVVAFCAAVVLLCSCAVLRAVLPHRWKAPSRWSMVSTTLMRTSPCKGSGRVCCTQRPRHRHCTSLALNTLHATLCHAALHTSGTPPGPVPLTRSCGCRRAMSSLTRSCSSAASSTPVGPPPTCRGYGACEHWRRAAADQVQLGRWLRAKGPLPTCRGGVAAG